MRQFIAYIFLLFMVVMQSCEQCYTCTNNYNEDDIIDHCGRGKDLEDVVDVQESLGYTCEKR